MLKKNSTTSKSMDLNSPDKLNRIVEGSTIKGEFNSESNIRVDGIIVGNVKTKGKLVLGVNGKITGDVICENAEIEGVFKGNIQVNDFLFLKSTAKIHGDIYAGKLAIEPGASFDGKCIMNGSIAQQIEPILESSKEKSVIVE